MNKKVLFWIISLSIITINTVLASDPDQPPSDRTISWKEIKLNKADNGLDGLLRLQRCLNGKDGWGNVGIVEILDKNNIVISSITYNEIQNNGLIESSIKIGNATWYTLINKVDCPAGATWDCENTSFFMVRDKKFTFLNVNSNSIKGSQVLEILSDQLSYWRYQPLANRVDILLTRGNNTPAGKIQYIRYRCDRNPCSIRTRESQQGEMWDARQDFPESKYFPAP